MALQPLNRPAGSVQRLRYRGVISVGEAIAAYPKSNATYPSNAPVVGSAFTAWVRFALFDSTDLTDTQRRLLASIYDDESPAGAAPHNPALCVPIAAGINNSDISLNTKTWAQNIQIHYSPIDANVVTVDNGVSTNSDGANGALVLLDYTTLTSGLGLGTNLPVIAVRFTVLTNEGTLRDFSVDLTFEITHSASR